MAKAEPPRPKPGWMSLSVRSRFALLLLIILGLVLAVNFTFSNLWSFNKAGNDFRPIDKKMKAMGAEKICSISDLGFDSGEFYFSSDYLLNYNDSITNTIKTIASQSGYSLQIDSSTLNYLKSRPYEYNSQNEYFVGRKGSNRLDVSIIRQGTGTPLISTYNCNASKVAWGPNDSPPQGKVLVSFVDHIPN